MRDSLGLVLVSLLLVCGCSETVTSHYSTRADAEADSLFARGWLPDIIPVSSRDIMTKNDLDRNVSEGEFFFSPEEASEFLGHLRQLGDMGSSVYSYSGEYSTWTFEANSKVGHCKYSMRLK